LYLTADRRGTGGQSPVAPASSHIKGTLETPTRGIQALGNPYAIVGVSGEDFIFAVGFPFFAPLSNQSSSSLKSAGFGISGYSSITSRKV
jgi:hypothetical protein